MIDLNGLCKVSLDNANQRHANGANIDTDTRKMLKHCATEVVEAVEAWTEFKNAKIVVDLIKNEEGKSLGNKNLPLVKNNFASELADIICCVLITAGKEEIDIEQAILDCIEKNRLRAEGKGDKK